MTYVKKPPFFENLSDKAEDLKDSGCKTIINFGRHGNNRPYLSSWQYSERSPTGEYFMKHQILPKDYNSYGSRKEIISYDERYIAI